MNAALPGSAEGFVAQPIGWVESHLVEPAAAPRQGDEGAPDATIVVRPPVAVAMADLVAGQELVVLTWLHRADRAELATRPRDDPAAPLTGVFSTRSPNRPNPIGLHRVRLLAVDGLRLHVRGLEAVDGTPVLDLKPPLGPIEDRFVR